MSDITVNNFKAFYEQIRPYLGAVHSGFTPIGTVISVMGTTAPLNYLACDGTVYNIADYPELAAYFNQQFGSSNFFGGNGTTTFAVPDLRGEFLRGTGTNSHANQGSGANVGVHQDGTEIKDVFYADTYQNTYVPGYNGDWTKLADKVDSQVTAASSTTVMFHSQSANTESKTNTVIKNTSRPTNTSVLYCIATKNIFMDAGSNYSTEEQVVGTWIDGKPIYQKTINFGVLPNATMATMRSVNHGISNIEYVVNFIGVAYSPFGPHSGQFVPLPSANPGDKINNVYMDLDGDSIRIYTGANKSDFLAYVTVLYTKTTD